MPVLSTSTRVFLASSQYFPSTEIEKIKKRDLHRAYIYMPRFKELPDATSPSLLMAAVLPSSMVAILLNSSLVFAFHPIYPCNADYDLLVPVT